MKRYRIENRKDLGKKITEETTLISGLLKQIAKAADENAEDRSWPGLGSLIHLREKLVEMLIGFEYRGDDEAETVDRILKRAKKEADTKFVAGSKRYKTQGRWVSVPKENWY